MFRAVISEPLGPQDGYIVYPLIVKLVRCLFYWPQSVIMLCSQTVAVSTPNGIIEVGVSNCGSKFKDLLGFFLFHL